MTKKILIAGGGYADIPMIMAAKQLGFHVITSGNRPGDLGHRYSDECQLEDFSDHEAMLRLARRLRIDAICSSCNDFSALSSAYVAEQMGLPGHDPYQTARTIHHKDLYRDFAHANGIESPNAEGFADEKLAIAALPQFRYPIIIKPVDLTGGKGITVARTEEDAPAAIRTAFERSRAKRIVIEEFIEGTRHGFSAFLRGGRVVFHFCDNEHYYLNPYMVSAASAPGDVPESALRTLQKTAEQIAGLLGLRTGIFHVQFILCETTPYIIEICRRPPGDLYTQFVHLATGVDYPAWIVRSAAGLDCSGLSMATPSGYFARHCIMSPANGKVADIAYSPQIIDNVIDQMMWWKPGDVIEDHLTAKCGIVFMKFDQRDEMLDKTRRAQELIQVVLD